ncbi:MAG: hypothetical protein VZR73_01075, partial [Acutalibacteraceae bacterium]|nr:hypothetical protein [Acutalibacteraceae bacterium]
PKGEAFETFPASPSGEVPSVSEAEGFLFLCNFQICSFIVSNIFLSTNTSFLGRGFGAEPQHNATKINMKCQVGLIDGGKKGEL